jgi:hypothetical protein
LPKPRLEKRGARRDAGSVLIPYPELRRAKA